MQKLIDTGFQEWWNFTGSCRDYFNGNYHYHKNIKYVLWRYENYLREPNRTRLISPTEYKNKFGKHNLDNTTDHITPQNPNFTIYTQEFRDNWLNNIGNLALMVWGDNAEKKSYNPIDKVSLFDSDFYTDKEIRDVLYSRKIWGESEIKKRRDKIINFIFKNWDLI
ncbi:MAG: HNH endonuclease [Methylococcales bacterium]|nr:HNH endonuclease [Methylococcales bacterium]